MEQLTKNQAVATSQEAVQNQNEPQLRDENAHLQLDNQKEIAEMQNETQKEIAGIQSATSRQNTKDQVYAQNEMLASQQKESTARVASIMEHTNLSKQQQDSEIMRPMLTQAQTAGQYFTTDQITEMTRQVSDIGRASCRDAGEAV